MRLYSLFLLAGCQGNGTSKPPPEPVKAIEVKDATGSVVARVVPGHPCRATVEGSDFQIGGPPLLAQVGADRWTGETAENGTTLKKNDQIVARIHAKQLFDKDGIPIIRVLESGDIADKANAVVRKIEPEGDHVKIGDLTVNTTDFTLAAMLTAKEALPEVRALVACELLQ